MCKPPTQLVLINSQNRISGIISAGTFSLAVCQSTVSQIRLENFVILNSFFAINASNNTFAVEESLGPSDIISIPPGTYDIVQFASEISSLLAASGVLNNTYTVAVSPTSLELTITATGGALDPFRLNFGGGSSYVLGWGRNAAVTAYALSHTSPFSVQLGNINKLLIRLETNVGGTQVWATSSATANFVVDIDVNFGSYFSYTPSIETQNVSSFPQPIVPRYVKVELIDPITGALVDTRGSEWQMELALWACSHTD